MNFKWSFIIISVVYAFFGVNHINTISFTLLPSLLATSGFLLIINYIHYTRKMSSVICGCLLVLFSSLYRFKIFLVCFAVIGVLYLLLYFIDFKNQNDKVTEAIKKLFNKRFIIILLIILTTTFSFNFISQKINVSTDELSYYKEYNILRSQLQDYSIPTYEEAKVEYNKIGISENDLNMLKNQYLDKNGAFSIENMKKMVQIQNKYNASNGIVQTFVSMCKIVISDTFFSITEIGISMWTFVGLFLLCLIFLKKRYYIVPITTVVLFLVINTYLWRLGRTPYRAIYSVIFACVILLLYLFSSKSIKNKFKSLFDRKFVIIPIGIVSLLLLMFITPITYEKSSAVSNIINNVSGHDEIVDYIDKNSNKKFIVAHNVNATNSYNLRKPWQINAPELPDNAITFYGTYYLTPCSNHKEKVFGTNNVYKYLINNKNAYFIDTVEQNQSDMFCKYLNEHYSKGSKIEMKLYKSIGDYRIYSVIGK